MENFIAILKKIANLPKYVFIYGGIALLLFILLYYPLGMLFMHKINDDVNFKAEQKFDIANGSHTVAIVESLINREVNENHWTPNDPFFYPSHLLIRMPSFQRGMINAISRFAIELSDQIGRARGSSQIDPDLEKAAGLLKYSPNVWVFDLSTSMLPTTPSEDQYIGASELFQKYNERLAKGQAVFDRRADNLMEALDRIATDMGSASAIIDSHIKEHSHQIIDTQSADIFYSVKGRVYVDYLLLRELKRDFADLIKEKQLENAWDNTLDSLKEGAELGHFFIFNATTNSQFLPNHLAVQGFYLMRARMQLREITNILLK